MLAAQGLFARFEGFNVLGEGVFIAQAFADPVGLLRARSSIPRQSWCSVQSETAEFAGERRLFRKRAVGRRCRRPFRPDGVRLFSGRRPRCGARVGVA